VRHILPVFLWHGRRQFQFASQQRDGVEHSDELPVPFDFMAGVSAAGMPGIRRTTSMLDFKSPI